jgi:predicted RNase H-like nuclease
MTRFLGVDLAWAEGSPAKQANESGLACIDEGGRVLDAGWARGTDAVARWIESMWEPGAVLAIDAPLVVNNAGGMRLCERETGSRYGSWHVSANASNLARPWQGGVSLRRRLEASGWTYTDGLTPVDPSTPSFFECYPYTTLVGAEEFGYGDKRPRYKRMGTALPMDERRIARAMVCDDLIQRLWGLTLASPPLDLSTHPVSDDLITAHSPLPDRAYKHREDLIDALLCAWTASLWWHHGTERSQVLGALDAVSEDGHRATIIAPARPEQRRAGGQDRPLRVSARGTSAL